MNLKKATATVLLAGALVTGTPAIASASPNGYHPDIVEEAPYYGPQGPIDTTGPKAKKVSGWGWVIFCAAAAGSLLNPLSW